jgi:signal transduction histidine kinase
MQALGHADRLDAYGAMLDAARERLATLESEDTRAIAALRQEALSIARSMRDVANAALLAKRDHDARIRDQRRNRLFEILATLVATMLAGLVVSGIVVRDQRNIATAEAALERERQVSRLHRAFISVVSHQFRTPLAIIDASAQRMMRRGALMPADEIAERAGKIRSACLRLTRLMESTINAARLEDGEINFTPRAFNVTEFLRGVRESQPEADQGRIELEIGELPQWIEADTTLLEQAVQNLLSNALKYSPGDTSVNVFARRVGDDILISVRDAGVGIPADEVGSLFRQFFRARTAQGIPGTGIGLSFVAQIMALHSGRVEVSSIEGAGSTFTLRFPCRIAGSPPSDFPAPASQAMT